MRLFSSVFTILIAGQAAALSCMPPSVEMMFKHAHEAKEIYIPVFGRFEAAPVKQPKLPRGDLPKGYQVQGSFEGKWVSKTGFGSPISTPVTINVTCVAHWCGGVPGNDETLAVLERRGTELILHQHACPSTAFANPSKEQLRSFRRCLRGGVCNPKTR